MRKIFSEIPYQNVSIISGGAYGKKFSNHEDDSCRHSLLDQLQNRIIFLFEMKLSQDFLILFSFLKLELKAVLSLLRVSRLTLERMFLRFREIFFVKPAKVAINSSALVRQNVLFQRAIFSKNFSHKFPKIFNKIFWKQTISTLLSKKIFILN